MTTTIRIPSPLRKFTNQQAKIPASAKTCGEALQELFEQFPEIQSQLVDEQGALRNFVNLFVNQEDIRNLQGLDTELPDQSELRIIPAIAGGAASLSPPELSRYARHLTLPEIGQEGQLKLKEAKVLVVGAGGLGCPATQYLAAAGVGTIGLVDSDVVEESNLQRQVLFSVAEVGKKKVDCAKERLLNLNPHIEIQAYPVTLNTQNALEIIEPYDLVIDGTDNFPTRYLVNDACVFLNKPNCYGSIFRFEGQASVFHHQGGPCYRCLYPTPPPPGLVPSCAEGGVLGVLPSLIGSIQATEAIKIIAGVGTSLSGRFLMFDALEMEFHELLIQRQEDCPVCGKNPDITELIDYQEFCGIPPEQPEAEDEITVQELKQRLDRKDSFVLLDVREDFELKINQIPNHTHIPMKEVPDHVQQWNPDDEIIVYCKMGGRAAKVRDFLKTQGFSTVKNLTGGIDAWVREIDPTQPRY